MIFFRGGDGGGPRFPVPSRSAYGKEVKAEKDTIPRNKRDPSLINAGSLTSLNSSLFICLPVNFLSFCFLLAESQRKIDRPETSGVNCWCKFFVRITALSGQMSTNDFQFHFPPRFLKNAKTEMFIASTVILEKPFKTIELRHHMSKDCIRLKTVKSRWWLFWLHHVICGSPHGCMPQKNLGNFVDMLTMYLNSWCLNYDSLSFTL